MTSPRWTRIQRPCSKTPSRLSGQALNVETVRDPFATLDLLRSKLRDGGYHVVQLLVHAVSEGRNGSVILADDASQVNAVPCEDVVNALLSAALEPPRLFFLATPPSADAQEAQVLASLGSLLAAAGVPAVVAIQGPMDNSTLARFTTKFYSTLTQTGAIDEAVRDARRQIYEPDSWEWTSPVLYNSTLDTQLFQPLPDTVEGQLTGLRLEQL